MFWVQSGSLWLEMKDFLDTFIESSADEMVLITKTGHWLSDFSGENLLLLPGSFNPLHEGHRKLLETAERSSGRNGILELSVQNVDKPPLSSLEIRRRLAPIEGRYNLLLTHAATFLEKAKLLPGTLFLIGADTAKRLLNEAYCPPGYNLERLLGSLRELNCRFMVAGREEDGNFLELEDLGLPQEQGTLFESIPEESFRYDISSSELRQRTDC